MDMASAAALAAADAAAPALAEDLADAAACESAEAAAADFASAAALAAAAEAAEALAEALAAAWANAAASDCAIPPLPDRLCEDAQALKTSASISATDKNIFLNMGFSFLLLSLDRME